MGQVARELKLVARVWDEGSDNRPGKLASSGVVLARTGVKRKPSVPNFFEIPI
ncbi:hypothetical protein [Urbifossiella limnaea]|uniref:Uncharacterized protein n=1 Tax=Urbifossiella limnaea TaxID=2528023 RepID=A0A517XXE8_9BACT|nr:hypothetical protein [Urbifossiella limnaea]QDU22202.1 hypothetical protein ETAA1_41790 [Urbifossiella limnaea]